MWETKENGESRDEGNEPVSPEDILVVWCAIIHLKLIFMRKKLIYEGEGNTHRESVCVFCIKKLYLYTCIL